MKFLAITLALVVALSSVDAEAARRLGGGKSVGRQSSNVTQREATPPSPAAPAQGATNAAPAQKSATAAPTSAAPAAAAQPRRPWGAMLGGLAAGLGLAWLAHSLGLGAAFGEFLLIALVVLAAMMLFGWFMRSRQSAQRQRQAPGAPYAFQGAGAGAAQAPPSYRPENVGNDASARPWERSGTMAFDPLPATKPATVPGVVIGSALARSQNWGVPADFDTEGFLRAAKSNFITLQSAWDRSDVPALRAMMTDAMLQEIRAQLNEREQHIGGQVNKTEVVMLEAQLLGIEDLGQDYMASVEFSGLIREEPSAGPSPFREVWNMTKPQDGSSGWLVAGVQALQ